jgi:ribosomal-protein-alanine N-acetyltransferase
MRVRAGRLDLAPIAGDEVEALVAGGVARLRELTGVLFPDTAAPPPYMADPLPVVLERLRARPVGAPWRASRLVALVSGGVVGSVAFGGPPDDDGAVLIGYAMYPQFEGHGYATEAVRAMIDWAFQQPGVRVVRALAPVWNTPALRVAENVGMRPVGANEDDDVGEVLVYALSAPASAGSV